MVAGAALVLSGCAVAVPSGSPVAPPNSLSLSPAGDDLYECITEKGWDVTLLWDGGVEASSETIPQEQLDLYRADMAECMAELDQRILAMTEVEIRAAYLAELVTRECLVGLGYDVQEPPSEQTYIDDFFGVRWTAYGESNVSVQALSDSEWRTLNESCPQPSWGFGAK